MAPWIVIFTRGALTAGAGFSSADNLLFNARISENNLFGRGTTLQLQAQISSIRQLFTLRYLDPYFLDTRLTFAFSIYNSQLFYPSFNRIARGGDLTFGYLLGDRVRVFATYKLAVILEDGNVRPRKASTAGGTRDPHAPPIAVCPKNNVANNNIEGTNTHARWAINVSSVLEPWFLHLRDRHQVGTVSASPLVHLGYPVESEREC